MYADSEEAGGGERNRQGAHLCGDCRQNTGRLIILKVTYYTLLIIGYYQNSIIGDLSHNITKHNTSPGMQKTSSSLQLIIIIDDVPAGLEAYPALS